MSYIFNLTIALLHILKNQRNVLLLKQDVQDALSQPQVLGGDVSTCAQGTVTSQ